MGLEKSSRSAGQTGKGGGLISTARRLTAAFSSAAALSTSMRRLILAGRFEDAFRIGEMILDRGPRAEVFDVLLAPLEGYDRDGKSPPSFVLHDLLKRLQASARIPAYEAWYTLLHAELLDKVEWTDEVLGVARRMDGFSRRYGWMRHRRGMLYFQMGRYEEAERDFMAVLESAPVFWKAKACIAEAALCQGDAPKAFKGMDELVERLQSYDRYDALAWRGEMRLWLGQYPEALSDLEEASARSAGLAACWAGGAYLKSGRIDEALRCLDAYLRRQPGDREALVWRGEAKRTLGKWDEALRDLDAALCEGPLLWAQVNRALVLERLGNVRGMMSDYQMLQRAVKWFFEWKLKISVDRDPAPENARAVLEAVLAAGKGVRRSDRYLYPIWVK